MVSSMLLPTAPRLGTATAWMEEADEGQRWWLVKKAVGDTD